MSVNVYNPSTKTLTKIAGHSESQGVDVLDTLEQINANTTSGKSAGALAVKELNNSLGNINLSVNNEGKLVFTDSTGADSVIPFSTIGNLTFSGAAKCVIYNTGSGGAKFHNTTLVSVQLPTNYKIINKSLSNCAANITNGLLTVTVTGDTTNYASYTVVVGKP